METKFKVGDCVQLLHGATPDMTISEIHELTNEAKCVWHDPKKVSEIFIQVLPLSVLKLCPKPASSEQINDIINQITPKRS